MRRLVATLVIGAVLVAACGDDDGDAAAPGTEPAASEGTTTAAAGGDTTTAAAAAPEHDPDAILRVIAYSPPAHLDPVRGVPSCELTHLRTIYDSLIRLDIEGRPTPGLAERWEVVDDLTFELYLRDGVTFQDGTAFDATAVKAHLDRAKTHPESTVTGALEVVESVEAVDPLTVRLHLAEARAGTLPTILAERAGIVPSPTAVAASEAAGDEYGATVAVGAGPYAFDQLVPRERLSVRAWGGDSYWDAKHRLLAGIDFYPVDDTLGLGRLQSGEVDYIATKENNLPQVEAEGLDYKLSPTNTFAELFVNFGVAPFDDKRVRQALNHAIDRELLVDTISEGGGTVAWSPLAPTSWAHDTAVDEMYAFDPERAQALLAEAGYPDGLSFDVAMIEHPYYTSLAQALQDMLAESGIDIELTSVIGSEINNALYVRKEFAAAITAYAGSTDPALTLEARWASYGNSNPSGTATAGLDELLAEGARSDDVDVRAESYRAAEAMVMEEALAVPVFFLGGLSVYDPSVHGVAKGYETCGVGNFIEPPVYVAA